MSVLQDFERLQEKLEAALMNKARLEGQLNQALSMMKKEFNCPDIASGKKLLGKLKKQVKELEADLREEIKEFTDEYGDLLE